MTDSKAVKYQGNQGNTDRFVFQVKRGAGIMEGKDKPDYARCVSISTAGAQREMLLPSLLAIIMPVVTGLRIHPVSGFTQYLAVIVAPCAVEAT